MTFKSWLNSLQAIMGRKRSAPIDNHPGRKRKAARVRLYLEELEHRFAPSVNTSTVLGAALGGTSVAVVTYGTPITFAATISPASVTTAPAAGSVDFQDGGTDLGMISTETVSGSNAIFTLVTTPKQLQVIQASGGVHTITATYFPGTGFNGSTGSLAGGLSVTPKPLTVMGITANNKVYDSTMAATLNVANAALLGVIGNDQVTLNTGQAIGTFAYKDVGNNIVVTVSGLSLDGLQALDYSILQFTPSSVSTWTQFQGNIAHTGYVPLIFNPANIAASWTLANSALGAGSFVPGVVSDGTNYYVTASMGSSNGQNNYQVFAISPTAGSKIWSYSHTAYGTSASAPSVAGNDVYAQFGGHSGISGGNSTQYPYMVGINSATGQQAFATNYAAQWGYPNQPTVDSNGVFAHAGYYGGFEDYGPASGSVLWTNTSMPQQTNYIPAADSTDLYVYMGTEGSSPGPSIATFYALKRSTGAIDYTITDPLGGGPANASNVVLGSQNDALASATENGQVVLSFNLANHTIRWRASVNVTGQMAVADGKVYVPAGNVVDVLDEATGTLLGQMSVGTGQTLTNNALVTINQVFVSSATNTFAFDRSTLQQVWSTNVGGTLSWGNNALIISNSSTVQVFNAVPLIATTANITPAPVQVSNITASNKVYDSTTTATLNLASTQLAGVLAHDVVQLASATGTYSTDNAGNALPVTITGLTLGGAQAADYTPVLNQPAPTSNITAAPLTITAQAYTKAFDNTVTAAAIPTVTGLKGADTVANLAEVFSNANLGTGKTLSVSAYTINDGNSGNNYAVTLANNSTGAIVSSLGTTTVITSSQASTVYGNQVTFSITVTALGGVASPTGTVDVRDNGNHDLGLATLQSSSGLVSTWSLTTGSKDLAVTTPTSHVVTALYTATGVFSASSGTLAGGLVVTPRALTASGIAANNKVYDGTTSATLNLTNAALIGVLNGDQVTINSASAATSFTSKDVANGLPVTVSLPLTGTQAADYAVTQIIPGSSALNWGQFQGNVAHTGDIPLTVSPSSLTAGWTLTNSAVGAGSIVPGVVSDGSHYYFTASMGSANGFNNYQVFAVSPSSGSTVWSYAHTTYNTSAAPPSVFGNDVYAQLGGASSSATSNTAAYMVGINSSTGQQIFATGYTAQFGYPNQPSVDSSAIFDPAGYYGGFQSYNALTGAVNWTNTSLTTQTGYIPAADSTDAYIFFQGFNAFNRITGALDYTIGGGISNGLNNVVIGSQHDALVGVTDYDLLNHVVRWRANVSPTGQPALADGKVFAPVGNQIDIFDEATGVQLGTMSAPSGQTLSNNLLVTNNLVFASTGSNTYAFDRSSLQQVWTVSVGGTLSWGNNALIISSSNAIRTFGGSPSLTTYANITPAPLQVTGLTVNNKVYDGTTSATLNVLGATFTGLVPGDNVTLTGGSGTFASKGAGASISVALTGLTLAGAQSSDYTAISQQLFTGNITAAPVWGIITKVSDGSNTATLTSSSGTLVGVPAGDNVFLNTNGLVATFASKDAGNNIPVTVPSLTLGGASAQNYVIGKLSGVILPSTTPPGGIAQNDSYVVSAGQPFTVSALPGVTSWVMQSQPGDYIGQGKNYSYSLSTGNLTVSRNYDNGVSFDYSDALDNWGMSFAAPGNATIVPGVYTNGARFPFQNSNQPGFDMSGDGRGSNTSVDQFTVNQAVYDASGNVVRFDATFIQHSEGAAAALTGEIKWNATPAAGVLSNDSATFGNPLSAVLGTPTSNGTLTLHADGTFVYQPNANFTGIDSFTYVANNGQQNSNVAIVTLDVAPVATITTVTASQGIVVLGTPVTFTANVSALSGTPTGTVEFFDTTTGADLGTGTPQSSAGSNATWSLVTQPNQLKTTNGADTISAVYTPLGGFYTSTGTLAGGENVTGAQPFFVVPYDATLYLKSVGGTGGATTDFGIGTSMTDAVPYLTGLPHNPTPNTEVQVGTVSANTSLNFYMKSVFGSTYWAFSDLDTTDPASITAFTDTDHSFSPTGNIVVQTSPTTWILHLDDAASFKVDDNDNDVLIQIRLAPLSSGNVTTTTTVAASAATTAYGVPVTFTATVVAAQGTPTGSVEFFDDTTNADLGPAVQAAGTNTWSLLTKPTQLQVHATPEVIRASYIGSGTFSSSQGSLAGGEKVNPAPLTIAAITNTKSYDSTTSAAAIPTVTGLLGSDSISGLTEVYSDATVGTGKALSVSAYTISDSNAGNNYTVTKKIDSTGVIATPPVAQPFFVVPYDATLYLQSVGGTGGATTEFGMGTSMTDAVAYFTNLPHNPVPSPEVQVGPVTANTSLNFYMKTLFGGTTYWAFSDLYTTDPASITAFSDTNHSFSPTGNIVVQTSPTTWVLHLDDAASYKVDDNDNDVLIQIRLAPLTSGNVTTTTTVAANTSTPVYGTPITLTATVSATTGTTAPAAGSVDFQDGSTDLGTIATESVSGSNAVFTLVTTPKQLQVIQTNGGVHTITATYSTGSGFSGSTATLAGGVKITPAPLTITATANTKTYDSTTTATVVPTVSGLLAGDSITGLTQTYGDKNAGTSKTLSVSAYAVNDGNGGNNYAVTTTANTTGVIYRAALTIAALTNTKTYDSTTSAAAKLTVSGLQGADTASGLAEEYTDRNAGSSKTLSVSAYAVSDGNGGNNYAVTTVSNSAGVITQKALTVTGLTANSKVYDSTTAATLNTANAALSGVIGTDVVTLNENSATSAFTTKNAGNNIEVDVAGLTLGGDQAPDYALIEPITKANITPAPLTLTAITNTKNYDGSTSAAAVPTASALVGNDTVTGLAEAYSDKNVGTGKTLSVSAYSINDGNGGNNYAVTTVANTTGAINKGVLLVKATTNTKSWDGTTSAAAIPTVTGLASGDTITGLAEVYNDTNVATGKTLSVNPGFNINDGNGGKNYTTTTATTNTGVINSPNSILTLPPSVTVIEPPQGLTYTVYLTLSVNQPLNYTVTYQTAAGTAAAGTDFTAINPGTIHANNVNNNQPTVQIPIIIHGGAYQQPGGPTFKTFTVQLNYAINNGSGNALTQALTGMPNTATTINLQQVFAPKISIAANQVSASPGVFVNWTTYWPTNAAFSAAQYAQAGGDVYLNYNTSAAGSLFYSATLKIAAGNFATNGSFQIPNFRVPARPPGGMLTVALVAVTPNAAIDPAANMGMVGYP